MYEIFNVRQVDGEPRRRWFVDDFFDLIVWFDENDEITGFQLCYNKLKDQHALTWHKKIGYQHNLVDEGESRPGKHKACPILLQNGLFLKNEIALRFKKAGRNLEEKVAALVYDKINKYSPSVSDS
jgi:hypothetical protein